MPSSSTASLPHVVIVGGGFGGLQAAKRLRKAAVRVTLLDRRNYHLFQPLLYQVATGGLSPANIATPLRSILRRQTNCEVLLAEVQDFDLAQRKLILSDSEIGFDYLILAAGATHSYFGNNHWEMAAPGLKTINDATTIRGRIFVAFEAAERETDPIMRDRWLTFVVVGAGPTGVELAGTLAEIAHHTLRYDFRRIKPEDARILLVEAADHVLSHYPPALCEKAADKIRGLGIEVHTQTRVVDVTVDHVTLESAIGRTDVPTRTILWAAGVQANPLGNKICEASGVATDRSGRVPVTPFLNLEGHDNVFVIGDLANCTGENGKPLPGMAPVAMQQGKYAADVIQQRVHAKTPISPFRYKNPGSMATIGRAAAVAEIGRFRFCGFFAWLLWLAIHLMQIVQFQNRLLVLLQWGWYYITFNRSARLITGADQTVILKQPATASPEPKVVPEESHS